MLMKHIINAECLIDLSLILKMLLGVVTEVCSPSPNTFPVVLINIILLLIKIICWIIIWVNTKLNIGDMIVLCEYCKLHNVSTNEFLLID